MRLELDGITAGYGDTVVLRDVDLIVPSGTVVALLGPNGAGKTTLLSTASGMLRPRAGRILLDDTDVTHLSADQRVARGLCHVTEGRSVFRALSVKDNLRMFSGRTKESEAIDLAVSAFPRLGERMAQIAGTLSGGEQQMLALARAYVSGASVILLDEVSMGLAPIIVAEIFAFLDRLADEGRSLLLVEQYVSKALGLADHVHLLSRGRIVYAGEPAELEGSDIFARYLGSAEQQLTASG